MINCDECKEGLKVVFDQLLSEEFITAIVDGLSGEELCGMEEDPEMCSNVIHFLIPLALPALAETFLDGIGQDFEGFICNMAIADTCPAY